MITHNDVWGLEQCLVWGCAGIILILGFIARGVWNLYRAYMKATGTQATIQANQVTAITQVRDEIARLR